jgi:hypothetical protein
MEVSFTVQFNLHDVEVERITRDAEGNAEIVLSGCGRQAWCRRDASGSFQGSLERAVLALAGVEVTKETEVILRLVIPGLTEPLTSLVM